MDIETLYFSSGVSRISILVIFIVMAFTQQNNKKHILHWFGALLSSSLGSLVEMNFSDSAVLPLHIALIVYPLFFFSLSASWSGVRVFYNRQVSLHTLLLITFSPCLIYVLAETLDTSRHYSISFVFFMAALLVGVIIFEILTTPDKRIISQYVVALAFSFYFFALITPAFMILFELMPAKQNSSAFLALLFDQFSSILIYFGYIAMAGERANLSLRKQAETDPLTNLINRRGAQEFLERYHMKSRSGGKCCVLIGDVDFFKNVNDTLGHKAGDTVLTGIAEVMQCNMRKLDKAVRWGGEEFLVVLPDTTIEEAEKLAERIRVQVQESSFHYEDVHINVTISIGVAQFEPTDFNHEPAIARADSGLYNAKKLGRNRVSS
jgi:diguanylate cyclase (GGDEF)-like protein